MLRVSKIVSLKSSLHFGFRIKTKRGLSPSTYTTMELTFEQPSSVSGNYNLVWADPDYLRRKLPAINYYLKALYLKMLAGVPVR